MTFGQTIWDAILTQPLGSMTKRELELTILQSAVSSKLVSPHAAEVAKHFRLTLSKAHGYLTDLALRADPLDDKEAFIKLSSYLKNAEIISGDRLLTLSIQDTGLWIERNLAEENLLQGESLRRDVLKLTPRALARLYSVGGHLPSPVEALEFLSDFKKEHWYKEFQKSIKPGFSWEQILETSAYLAKVILPFFPRT